MKQKIAINTFLQKLTPEQKKVRQEILKISHEGHVSHIGSCFSAVDIISAIYSMKKHTDIFVLSAGHAAVALYAVLNLASKSRKYTLDTLHIHPDRNEKMGISVSSGSLGQGLPIAVGRALANRKKRVYCLISDGECAEGSIWESLRIAHEQKLGNLCIVVNYNGFGAYQEISMKLLLGRIVAFAKKVVVVDGHVISDLTKVLSKKTVDYPLVVFAKTHVAQLPFLSGQDAHYKVMSEQEYNQAMELLQ